MVNQSIEKQPLGALFKSNFASGIGGLSRSAATVLGYRPLVHVREQVVLAEQVGKYYLLVPKTTCSRYRAHRA